MGLIGQHTLFVKKCEDKLIVPKDIKNKGAYSNISEMAKSRKFSKKDATEIQKDSLYRYKLDRRGKE